MTFGERVVFSPQIKRVRYSEGVSKNSCYNVYIETDEIKILMAKVSKQTF